MIQYGKQSLGPEERQAILEVLNSDFLTTGPKVPIFEASLKDYVGASYCTVVSSATAALHIAMVALDIKQGDHIWTSPISFVATANAGRYVGADVSFIDIELDTINISANLLDKKLAQTSVADLPKAIVFVHMAGNPTSLIEISKICKKYNIKLIEDASHSLGSLVKYQKTGGCAYSDVTVFSFHPVKMITSGEGGALLTNDESIDKKAKLLRNHGITRSHSNPEQLGNSWYYEQIELGYNYRMSDLHASIGIEQLKKLSNFVRCRNDLAQRYNDLLIGSSIKIQKVSIDYTSAYHLFIIQFHSTEAREAVFQELLKLNIKCNLHYIPIYKFPYYVDLYGRQEDMFPNAELYFQTALTLPLFVDLEPEIVNQICSVVLKHAR
jgi:UDP-4-amino-4,6-dideoxy-N-acetyl-beta-L-altrosamine transaminase